MIEFRVLGPPTLADTSDGHRAPIGLQPKPLALLAYLALSPKTCRRDTLLTVFWPDLDEMHARNALSQALYRIRRTVGVPVIVSRGRDELSIDPECLWCDAPEFLRATTEARHNDALDLYHGPLMEGLHVADAPGYEYWLDMERERHRLLARRAATSLADRAQQDGNPADSAHWLRTLMVLSPDDEVALRRLMKVLDVAGDRKGALHAYSTFAHHLSHELDLAPSAKAQALGEQLRKRTEWLISPSPATPSVAVMPFANVGDDPEQEFVCSGITEQIIQGLTRMEGLRVAARTSTFTPGINPDNICDLARELGADAILDGSILRTGERVQIKARLTDGIDGNCLWAERFDRSANDIFFVHEEIARSIAAALNPAGSKHSEGPHASEQKIQAHTYYLKGLFHRRKRTPEGLRTAVACFEHASTLYGDYAPANAALAYACTLGGWFIYDAFTPEYAHRAAESALTKALAVDDRIVEAQVALGFLRWAYEWDWEGGEQALLRALLLDAQDPAALSQYSSFLVICGRIDEAISVSMRLEQLEPFWIGPKVYKGAWQFMARRYSLAIDWLEQAQELEPNLFIAPYFLSEVFRLTNRYDEADAALTRALSLVGRQPLLVGRIAALRAAQGRTAEANCTMNELHSISKERYVRPTIIADVFLASGEYDEMFAWLDRACSEKDPMLTLLGVHPAYDPVRTDPRFQQLIRRIGFTEKEP